MLPHHGADAVLAAVSPVLAAELLRTALLDGLDPAADPPRTSAPLGAGQLLTMPSARGGRAGVKLALVAPGNARRGLATVQGVYLLLDAATLVPLATLDAPALTALRTPATSVAATAPVLARAAHPARVVVVGSGVQARGHARALLDHLAGGRGTERLDVLVRRPAAAGPDPVPRSVGGAAVDGGVLELGGADAREALRRADVVVCATSAAVPVLDSRLLRDDVVAIAVGAHEPDRRELDAALLGRSTVVVEDVATALREAGDVVMAIGEGALLAEDLVAVADLLRGRSPVPEGAVVFKGTGMAWQDLVVADAVHRRLSP